MGNVGDNCLACARQRGSADLLHPRRAIIVAAPNWATRRSRPLPVQPSSGTGIFWREDWGVPLQADHRRHLQYLPGRRADQMVTQWNEWVEANATVGSTAVPLNYLAPGVAIQQGLGSIVLATGASDTGTGLTGTASGACTPAAAISPCATARSSSSRTRSTCSPTRP